MDQLNTRIGTRCSMCGKLWLPGPNGTIYHDCTIKPELEIDRLRALLSQIEDLAAHNLTGCGTCTSVIDAIRAAHSASGAKDG